MLHPIRNLIGRSPSISYRREQPLILVNGLAEQAESWYPNRIVWQKHFDVHTPGVLVYGGPVIQERLTGRKPIDIDFLTGRLAKYLDQFVQAPPYHLVSSSLGGQISLEYAARHPEKVGKLVLLCPSGFGTGERLPIKETARSKNYQQLVESTFYDKRLANPQVVEYYEKKFRSKPWRRAFFETVRSTKSNSVLGKLMKIRGPALVICGREDQIVDSHGIYEAVKDIPNFEFKMIPHCGHAPQLECPRLINRLVKDFLSAA